MSPPRPAPPAPSAPGLVLLACTLGFVLISLDITVVNVALETLRAAFGSSVGGLQWVLNGYTLAFASLLLSTGALGDRLGHRPMLLAGLALFTLASIGCGLAGSIGMLVAARVLQGVGAALCVPASLTLINLTFPERRARARAIGIWAGTASMAMGAGPIVGGLLVSHFGWPSIFFINVPFGLAGLWLTLAHAPRRPRGPARGFDLPGQLMAILALAGLATACIESGQTGWTSAPVIGGGAAFLLCGAAFLALEARSRAPMLPLGLFASAPLRCASAIGLLLNFGYYGVMFAISLYFQAAKGYGPLAAGLAFLPMTAVLSGVNFAAGRLDARFGSRRVIRAGLGLSLLGYLSVSGITAATPYALIMLALVAIGVGMALCVPAISTVLMEDTPAERAGIASGLFNTARQLGGVIGVGIFGSLLATGADLAAGMRLAFLLSSLAMLLALGVAQRGLRPGAAGPAARRA